MIESYSDFAGRGSREGGELHYTRDPSRVQTETSRKTARLLLVPIVALAFGLRFWGIGYGIPHPTARPDEERIVGRAQTIFATGEWHPGSFYYPSLLFYADTFALYGYYEAKRLMGDYERPFDLLFEIAVTRPGLHYRIARFVSLLAGVATVLATYALGVAACENRRRRRAIGLLAALAVAVCHLHVRDSHFATVDVPSALFATLALVFATRALSSRPTANAMIAGLFAGLAASTKYNVGLVALAIVVAVWRVEASFRVKGLRVAAAALASMAAFAATSPFVVRRFGAFWSDMDFLEGFLYGASESPLALWGHLGTTLPDGLGLPLFAAATLGVVRAVYRRSDSDSVLLSFLLPFFALVASVRITFPRYVIPLVPLLAVLAAESTLWLFDRLRVAESKQKLALAAAVVILVVPTLWSSVAFDHLAARPDTRLEAWDYVAKNVPPQTKILLCRGYGAPSINQDRRRPPAYRVEEMDCFSATAVSTSTEASFLVTHEHRELSSFSRVHPELSSWLEEHRTEVAVFDPYREGSERPPNFYGADAFYLPFAGFSAVRKGGPLVRIWSLAAR